MVKCFISDVHSKYYKECDSPVDLPLINEKKR